ncbi:MAG: DUF1684 domain-containing protein [Acidobacteriota bacterium]
MKDQAASGRLRTLFVVTGSLAAALTLACNALSSDADSSSPAAAPSSPVASSDHRAEVEAWRAKRHQNLLRRDGWLSLVGLFWLQEGSNSFGSDAGNDFVHEGEGTPSKIGVFTLENGSVRFDTAPGVTVLHDGAPVVSLALRAAGSDESPVLEWGPLSWFVIKRGTELAVRLKSVDSPALKVFEGVKSFAVDPDWRLPGRFEPYQPPKSIMIPNILGTVGEEKSPGAAVFELAGETYRLDLWKDSDDPANFFTAFGDETNRDETYGGGRFLWIDAPGEDGGIVVDFNKSYNPPCVFTNFATCPLPPEQNRLPLSVRAGEMKYQAGH